MSLCSFAALIALAGYSSAFAAPALNALPTGGTVAAGQVAISQSGNTLTVNQTTNQAIVNWNSFNIGANAKVVINQPSANSVQLDRVTGNNASQIFGQLTSNGQVI
ncbi:filamentous hemagglutinin N-terminal domain-containing protein, partial [Polynucleobacter sp. QLW-P1DATA-2]|uniref:two-partner secretion domain-containing protein n=1 Tax=Polynucleobacter sp. QLW-P1DATA-2 TaxID=1743167 RepID=UPI0011601704